MWMRKGSRDKKKGRIVGGKKGSKEECEGWWRFMVDVLKSGGV